MNDKANKHFYRQKGSLKIKVKETKAKTERK
jgi:hypothetical protein